MGLENIPSFKKGSKIHIKKENRGKFTKSAKAAGESVQEHAAKVLRDPNATPLQKKRANFARNAKKWKHQFGGTIRTKEEVDRVNQSNKNTAKGMFKGIMSGNILPTLGNVGRMIGAAWNGWVEPETTAQIGAPTILPGMMKNPKTIIDQAKVLRAAETSPYLFTDLESVTVPKGFIKGNEVTPVLRYPISEEGLTVRTVKPMKLENPITNEAEAQAARDWLAENKVSRAGRPAGSPNKGKEVIRNFKEAQKAKKAKQSVADAKDKDLIVSRKVNTSVKNGMTYEDMDARHVNAGRNRRTAAQRDQAQYIVTNHYQSSDWYKRLQDIFKKQAKSEAKGADKAVLAKFRKQRNDVLDDFLNWYNRK